MSAKECSLFMSFRTARTDFKHLIFALGLVKSTLKFYRRTFSERKKKSLKSINNNDFKRMLKTIAPTFFLFSTMSENLIFSVLDKEEN